MSDPTASGRPLLRTAALVGVLVAAAALLAAPGDALAQCSMCRTALEQNTDVAAGFNRAILFLLAMPYALFASGAGYVLVTRRRTASSDQEGELLRAAASSAPR